MRLYGINSVSERLKVNPKTIKRLFIEKGADLYKIEQACRAQGIPVQYSTEKELYKRANNIRTQGVIAQIEEFSYGCLDDILACPKENLPVFLFLDNLNDPQNLGSILRTAACLGGFAVVLPKHDSVEVTEAVLRVAQGGENYVPVVMAKNLSSAIKEAKEADYRIAGSVIERGEDLRKAEFSFPLGIVIGSEAKGIRQGLLGQLDYKVTIPMETPGLSFNAAVACALFCYETSRQKGGIKNKSA